MNGIWEYNLPEERKIGEGVEKEERMHFIRFFFFFLETEREKEREGKNERIYIRKLFLFGEEHCLCFFVLFCFVFCFDFCSFEEEKNFGFFFLTKYHYSRKKYLEREYFNRSYGHFVKVLENEKKGKWVDRFVKFEVWIFLLL